MKVQLAWSLAEQSRSKGAGNPCRSMRWWTSGTALCEPCVGLHPESRLADDLIVRTRFGLAVACACAAVVALPGVAASDTTLLDTTSVPTVSPPLPTDSTPTTSTPLDPLVQQVGDTVGTVTGTDPINTVTQPSNPPNQSPSNDGSSGSTGGRSTTGSTSTSTSTTSG